MQRWRN